MTPRAPGFVFFALLFGAFALALVEPVLGGTEAAPEVVDPANDHEVQGTIPAGPPAGVANSADVVAAWIQDETATEMTVIVKTSAGPATTNNVEGVVTLYDHAYEFIFTVAGTSYTASLRVDQIDGVSVGGVAASGSIDQDLHYAVMVVPKANIGNPAAGAVATGIFVDSNSEAFNNGSPITISDRAPNDGSGQDYIFSGGSGNQTTVPGDSDNDMLNDTCEQEFFGGLNGTNNATEDPDGDGLTNGQECASNPRTDPTKADTDGDGTSDKDDPYPTDATKGGTSSSTNSATGSGSASSSTSSSKSGTGSNSTSGTGGGNGEVKNLGDAVEKLKSDIGYLGISAGGLFAVLLLAILALAVRWSL